MCQAALQVIQTNNENRIGRTTVNTLRYISKKQLPLPKPTVQEVERTLTLPIGQGEKMTEVDMAEEDSAMLFLVCLTDISTAEYFEFRTCKSWKQYFCENLIQNQLDQYTYNIDTFYECRS